MRCLKDLFAHLLIISDTSHIVNILFYRGFFMKKLFSVVFFLCSTVQAYQYSIPTLSEERITQYSNQYSWELWRTKWAKRGIKTGAVAGAAVLAYSAAKGYLFGKKGEEQEAGRLLKIYESLDKKGRALLEGAASLILKRSAKAEMRGWFDRSYLKDQAKKGFRYATKEVLPGLILTPVLTQAVGTAANKTVELFADRSLQWFIITRTKLLPLGNELKKTAAFLDPDCQIFKTVKTMQMLVSPNAPIEPQMRQMLLEMLQLKVVATAGEQASDADKDQARELFISQATDLIYEIEKVIGFMESKLAGSYNEHAMNAIDTLKKSVNECCKAMNKSVSEDTTDQSLLASVIMFNHHVQQTLLQ